MKSKVDHQRSSSPGPQCRARCGPPADSNYGGARRARQRKVIRSCRLKGKRPPQRALLSLAAHHTRPQFRELMGKQGNHRQWSGKWPAAQDWGSSCWDLWGSAMDGAAHEQYWGTTGSWERARAWNISFVSTATSNYLVKHREDKLFRRRSYNGVRTWTRSRRCKSM